MKIYIFYSFQEIKTYSSGYSEKNITHTMYTNSTESSEFSTDDFL